MTEEQRVAWGTEEVTQEQPQRAAVLNPCREHLSGSAVLTVQHVAVRSVDQSVKLKQCVWMHCPSPAADGFQRSTHPVHFP